MLYQLVEYYTKNPDKRIDISEYATYQSNKLAFLVPSPKPVYYWFKTLENFGYLYDQDKKLVDHYTRKTGTNIYKSHQSFAGGELILTDTGKYMMECYGSGIPVIDCSAGLVNTTDDKKLLNYNWPIPQNNCLECWKLEPKGPFSDPDNDKDYNYRGIY